MKMTRTQKMKFDKLYRGKGITVVEFCIRKTNLYIWYVDARFKDDPHKNRSIIIGQKGGVKASARHDENWKLVSGYARQKGSFYPVPLGKYKNGGR